MTEEFKIFIGKRLAEIGFPKFPDIGEYVSHDAHPWITIRRNVTKWGSIAYFESDALGAKCASAKLRIDFEVSRRWEKRLRNWIQKEAIPAHKDLLVARKAAERARLDLASNCHAYRYQLNRAMGQAPMTYDLEVRGVNVVGIKTTVTLKGTPEEVAKKLKNLK